MKLPPQAQTVLRHMRGETNITGMVAEGLYKIRRLASRVDELVAAGYEVLKEEAKDATGQRYLRYSLSERQRLADKPLHPTRKREPRITLAYLQNVMEELDFHHEDISDVLTHIREKA